MRQLPEYVLMGLALAAILLLLGGCGVRAVNEASFLEGLAGRVSAPEVRTAPSSLELGVAEKRALQTCLLLPPKLQTQCLVIHL